MAKSLYLGMLIHHAIVVDSRNIQCKVVNVPFSQIIAKILQHTFVLVVKRCASDSDERWKLDEIILKTFIIRLTVHARAKSIVYIRDERTDTNISSYT